MKLNSSEQNFFREKGILALKGALAKKDVGAVKAVILKELKRLNVAANSKAGSSRFQSLPMFQQITALSNAVQVGPILDKLFPSELTALTAMLAGAKLKPQQQPQLLLSLPHKTKWSLNQLNWHLDLAVPFNDEVSGVQAFVLIDDLAPHGGATLALAGSHRLNYVKGTKKDSAQAVLRGDAYFSRLFEGSSLEDADFSKARKINGVEVSIVEMCGNAGDVYLMDMRLLHSPSANATKNIRMMATARWIR